MHLFTSFHVGFDIGLLLGETSPHVSRPIQIQGGSNGHNVEVWFGSSSLHCVRPRLGDKRRPAEMDDRTQSSGRSLCDP